MFVYIDGEGVVAGAGVVQQLAADAQATTVGVNKQHFYIVPAGADNTSDTQWVFIHPHIQGRHR